MPKKKKPKKRLRIGRLLLLTGAALIITVLLGSGGGYAWQKFRPAIEQLTNSDTTASPNTLSHDRDVEAIKKKNALDIVTVTGFSDEELRDCFYSAEIDEKMQERLKNMGYSDQIPLSDLRYVRVLYQDFDGHPRVGELIVNQEIAQKIENVFFDLFTHKYQIGKMILPDAYGTNISESYADNNTVALCFGLSEENAGSVHEKGFAVDLNPLYNPLIRDNGTSLSVFPMEGQLFLDRTVNAPHYIYDQDYAVEAFAREGFVWKGSVDRLNDYKHFEYGSIPSNASTTDSSAQVSSQTSAQESSQSEQYYYWQPEQEQAPVQEEQTPAVEEPVENTGESYTGEEYVITPSDSYGQQTVDPAAQDIYAGEDYAQQGD